MKDLLEGSISMGELERWFAAEEKQQRLSLVEGKDGI